MQQTSTIEIESHADSDQSKQYTIYGPKESAIDAVSVDTVKISRLTDAAVTFEAGIVKIDFDDNTPYTVSLTTASGIGDEKCTTATITIGEA